MPPSPRLRLRAGEVAALVAVAAVTAGCSSTTTPSSSATAGSESASASATASASASPSDASTFGGYPSFLPSDTVGEGFAHRVVDASARRPVLATQGDTVRVHLGSDTALVTVTGPAVPVEGQQYQAPTSPATWRVVVRDVRGDVPLDPATFQAIDEDGAVHDLQPQGRIPSRLAPGDSARFALFSPAFTTGEGRLRWIPVGHLAPVEWDFVVETD